MERSGIVYPKLEEVQGISDSFGRINEVFSRKYEVTILYRRGGWSGVSKFALIETNVCDYTQLVKPIWESEVQRAFRIVAVKLPEPKARV